MTLEQVIEKLENSGIHEIVLEPYQLLGWLKERRDTRELESKHWSECMQIAHYDDELKELREKVSGGDVLRICEQENYINAIYEELSELFGSPCNFSPMDDYMLENGGCDDCCGDIADKECWSRYFQTKFINRRAENG